MWSIALLVNANDWAKFRAAWHVICETFCAWHIGVPTDSNRYYDTLLSQISNIKGNPNISASINTTRDDPSCRNDVFDFNEEQDSWFAGDFQPPNASKTTKPRKRIPRVSCANISLTLRYNDHCRNCHLHIALFVAD
jgi:hypothetical protein